MITQRIHRLAGALALAASSSTPLAAQALAYRDLSPPAPPAAAYHLRLTSTWPQLGNVKEGCSNGGDEVLEGTLTSTGSNDYAGRFTRRTLLRFCGAHGSAGAACELVLRGEGEVAMTGTVRDDEASPTGKSLWLSWVPAPSHRSEVQGACPDEFKRKLEAMYLTVQHRLEFDLPKAGSREPKNLEEYAWRVEIQ